MAVKSACWRELTKLVANHVFSNEHGDEFLAVVNRESEAYHIGNNSRSPRPGLDNLPRTCVSSLRDFPQYVVLYKRTLMYRTGHCNHFLRLRMNLSEVLPRLRVLYPLVGTPHGVTG